MVEALNEKVASLERAKKDESDELNEKLALADDKCRNIELEAENANVLHAKELDA